LSRRNLPIDRRRDRRFSIEFTFCLRLVKGRTVLAQAVDLSPRGIRFQHLGPGVEKGDAVLVQFTLGPETFSFCGLPLRVKLLGSFIQEVALTFVGMDPKTRMRLQAALTR
jgi:hypothetical protein